MFRTIKIRALSSATQNGTETEDFVYLREIKHSRLEFGSFPEAVQGGDDETWVEPFYDLVEQVE